MVEGLISLTLLTTKGATTKPLLGLVVTNGLALLGGTAIGGLVTYPLTKRREGQEKERLSEALEQAQAQLEEADGLRQQLATAQAEVSQLLSNAAEVAQVVSTAEGSEGEAPEVSVEVPEAPEAVPAPVPDDLKKIKVVETAEVSEAEAPEASVEVPEAPEAVPAPVPDNLKKIKGIGKVFEGRLNEAGIWTFADLVETEPERLREIVSSGRVENMIHPEEWIEQARQWVK
jgi:predicted flap endonuclease-1-like 5' DNA nuclease